MIVVVVGVRGRVGIIFTPGFFSAVIANAVLVTVYMVKADELALTAIADPVLILIRAQIREPSSALITFVIAVFINVASSALFHAEGRTEAIIASAIPVTVYTAIEAHPYSADVAIMVVAVIAVQIVSLRAPGGVLAYVADSVKITVLMHLARNITLAEIADAVAVFIRARKISKTTVASAVLILVVTHIKESLKTARARMCFIVYDAFISKPNLTVVALVVVVFVRVLFSCYGTDCRLIANVALSVIIAIKAIVNEAYKAYIADMVAVAINESMHLFQVASTIITVSVIVLVGAFKNFGASVAHVVAVLAVVQAIPYDVVVNVLGGHCLVLRIVFCELIALNDGNFGRRDSLTELEVNHFDRNAFNLRSDSVNYDEAYFVSYPAVIDFQNSASVGKNNELFGAESFKDIFFAVIVQHVIVNLLNEIACSSRKGFCFYKLVFVAVCLFDIMLNLKFRILVFPPDSGINDIVCRHFLDKLINVKSFLVYPAFKHITNRAEYGSFGKLGAVSYGIGLLIVQNNTVGEGESVDGS